MTPANRLELAAAARANVVRVMALLERPSVSALERSAAELAGAIARMEELQGEFADKPIACPTKSIIEALRKDLGRVGRLLRNAWDLRIGRGSQLEYSKKGEWVRASSTTRWTIEV